MTLEEIIAIGDASERRAAMIEAYGEPERIDPSDALAQAVAALIPLPVPVPSPQDVWASVCRDQESAQAWAAGNLRHHGHPVTAYVPLADGRVIYILDLRPALAAAMARQNRTTEEFEKDRRAT
jgi:hypothetical protein